jgi:hypothetical protein
MECEGDAADLECGVVFEFDGGAFLDEPVANKRAVPSEHVQLEGVAGKVVEQPCVSSAYIFAVKRHVDDLVLPQPSSDGDLECLDVEAEVWKV